MATQNKSDIKLHFTCKMSFTDNNQRHHVAKQARELLRHGCFILITSLWFCFEREATAKIFIKNLISNKMEIFCI